MSEYTRLPADLPEDWAPSQVVTPEGVEAGLPERYGYNYLMKQVNEAQRMCNRLLEELVRKADKRTPQKYNLELLNGFEKMNSAEYFKTEDGQVTVLFRVSLRGGEAIPAGNYVIANLPEGFRPLTYIPHSTVSDGRFEGIAMVCWVDTSGDLKVKVYTALPKAETTGFVGSITYFTA